MSEVTTAHTHSRSSSMASQSRSDDDDDDDVEDCRRKGKARSIHSQISSMVDRRPLPLGLCRICMDQITGVHYGVPSCEGCKGFFKRSLSRETKYQCYFGNKCVINTDTRNRCKACRLKKCLEQGMSVDGIRMGRIPKSAKENLSTEQDFSYSNRENDNRNAASNKNDRLCVDLTKCADGEDSSSMIDEKMCATNVIEQMKKLLPKLSFPVDESELNSEEVVLIRYLRWKILHLSNICNQQTRQCNENIQSIRKSQIEHSSDNEITLQDILVGLADAIPFHVENLLAFAHQTPAINSINANDFHKMMNNRLFDFWMMKHAPLMDGNDSSIMLPNGCRYRRQWMSKVLGEEMVEKMFEFANRYNALDLTEEEQALILPCIICSDDDTLDDQQTIKSIQCCYLYVLYTQMLKRRTQNETKTVFKTLLKILSLLRYLNKLQEKKQASLDEGNMEYES